LPYDRDLPGEIMFWDATDVAESLSWERNLTGLAAQLRSLGPDSGRPIPACWVIATQGLFLVTALLPGSRMTTCPSSPTSPSPSRGSGTRSG
jgi:hypothetical protein